MFFDQRGSWAVAAALAGVLSLPACSGGSKQEGTTSTGLAGEASDAQPSESAEEVFERQKADALTKMCEVVVDCGIAEAPEEDKAGLVESKDMFQGECMKAQGRAPYSPRQVQALRACLSSRAADCADFNACLGELIDEAGGEPGGE